MSTAQRRISIIAVFGSNEHLPSAESVGCEVARRGSILLTGGIGINEDAVKEKAIAGAKDAARNFKAFAPWIGVARDKRRGDSNKSEDSLVIHPGFNHKRNYIEACLCDVAIAFEGGGGTLSEVIFCLSLGKPVVLVGDRWRAEHHFDRFDEKEVRDSLMAKVCLKMQASEGSQALDCFLESVPQSLENGRAVHEFSSQESASQIVDRALRLSKNAGLSGEFPGLDGFDDLKAEYNSWLTVVEARLTLPAELGNKVMPYEQNGRDERVRALAERSRYVENVLKHAFVAQLASEVWARDPFANLQVYNSEVDDSGFDIVLQLGSHVRYVQLKQTRNDKVPRSSSVRLSFAVMPGSCVVLMSHSIDKLHLTHYRFWGAGPSEPMQSIAALKATKSPIRRDTEGKRKLRTNYRDVPVGQFKGPLNTGELLDLLFPSNAASEALDGAGVGEEDGGEE
jgi:predicted Rossmann-fold nucleotide-binding protein